MASRRIRTRFRRELTGGVTTVDGALPRTRARRRTHRRVRRLAHTFLTAFLRYETGQRSRSVVAGVRATTDERFGDLLLSEPPRLRAAGGHPNVAAIEQLTAYGPVRGRLKVIAVLRRDGRRDVLELAFRRTANGWRVAALG